VCHKVALKAKKVMAKFIYPLVAIKDEEVLVAFD